MEPTYTTAQLERLRSLASAYGHWYAEHIIPAADAGMTHAGLVARLDRRADAAAGPDAPAMPRVVAGPPSPIGYHTSGTGRLTWRVDGDGSVTVQVWRPHPEVVRLRARESAACEADYASDETAAATAARRAAEAHLEPVQVLDVSVAPDGVVTVREARGHHVRHVDALREALAAVGARVPTGLYAGAVDIAAVARDLREQDDIDLVLHARGLHP